jgi:hypothetical protein
MPPRSRGDLHTFACCNTADSSAASWRLLSERVPRRSKFAVQRLIVCCFRGASSAVGVAEEAGSDILRTKLS